MGRMKKIGLKGLEGWREVNYHLVIAFSIFIILLNF